MPEIEEVQQIAIDCGMPIRFSVANKNNFTENRLLIIKRISDILIDTKNENYFTLIYGKTGVGKSYLASYIFMSLIFKYPKYKYSWISLLNLNEKIKATFSNDYNNSLNEGSENNIIWKYCYRPNLLVFEFGDIQAEGNVYGGNKSPFVTQLFHRVIDYRWQRRMKTLFITPLGGNQELHKQLIKHYDEPTVGRLLEDCQLIKMSGIDNRLKKAKQRSIWEI